MELWAGCIAGALEESTYRQLLAEAGFQDVEVEVTRVLDALPALAVDGGRLVSAFVRATKPPSSRQPGEPRMTTLFFRPDKRSTGRQ
jgi:arsenite methyltransferase